MSDKVAPIIYVMENGRMLVGRLHDCDGPFIILHDCAVIRIWGTTNGLGQLAMEGPQSGTKLDAQPNGTELRMTHCIEKIPCNAEAWKDWHVQH